MEKRFKYDLETIYSKANELAKEYQGEGKTETEKHFILAEFLKVTEELTWNQCNKFLRGKGTRITAEELYEIAITEPLLDVLKWYDFEQGDNIVVAWFSFIWKRFCNALNEERTTKAVWHKQNVYSSDKALNEDGNTVLDLVGEEDFSDSICTRITLSELLDKFEERYKHGEVIRCFLIGKQKQRTEAILKVLGADSYGDKERKKVQMVKERFIRFLIRNGYDLTGYNIEKFI